MDVQQALAPERARPGRDRVERLGGDGDMGRSSGTTRLKPDSDEAYKEFRAIYDAWFEDVIRWIRALGGLEADREDIAQEVFLVVRRRLDAFDGVNPAGWLYQITRRQVRDSRRRTWVKHIFNKRRSDEPDVLPHAGASPAHALEEKEKQRILHSLLMKMNEDRRSAFVLFEIEGLSGEEIARVQSVPLNTVWTRLYHARKEFLVLAEKYQRANGRGTPEAASRGDGENDSNVKSDKKTTGQRSRGQVREKVGQ